jgi:hypothetical protein
MHRKGSKSRATVKRDGARGRLGIAMRFVRILAVLCAACGSRSELIPVEEVLPPDALSDAAFAPDARCTWGFAPLVSYAAGTAPVAVTIADLDSDGHPDLAVNNYGGDPCGLDLTLVTLHNTGLGTFTPWHTYDSAVSFSIAAGALVSATSVDLLAGCDLFPNEGRGMFGAPLSYGTQCGAQDSYNNLVLADFDGDGRTDFAWAMLTGGLVVQLNRGGGNFDPVDTTINPVTPYMDTMTGADLDHDGRPDLAGTSWGYGFPSYIRLFHNTGDGSFGETDLPAGDDDLDVIAAGDLDGDGWPDLVVDDTSYGMEVLLNRRDGTFGPPAMYPFSSEVRSIAIGDLDGDGASDVVFGGYGIAALGVFHNRGDGTFAPAVDWPVTNSPWSVALGDLNGDGHLDVAAADTGASGTSTVDVFLSQCQ